MILLEDGKQNQKKGEGDAAPSGQARVSCGDHWLLTYHADSVHFLPRVWLFLELEENIYNAKIVFKKIKIWRTSQKKP